MHVSDAILSEEEKGLSSQGLGFRLPYPVILLSFFVCILPSWNTEQRLGLIEKDIHTALGKSRPFKALEPMSHRPIIPEKFRAGNFLSF